VAVGMITEVNSGRAASQLSHWRTIRLSACLNDLQQRVVDVDAVCAGAPVINQDLSLGLKRCRTSAIAHLAVGPAAGRCQGCGTRLAQ
jgi:hypothetical protein